MFPFCTALPWKPYAIRVCQGIHSIQGLNTISLYISFFFFKNKNKNMRYTVDTLSPVCTYPWNKAAKTTSV